MKSLVPVDQPLLAVSETGAVLPALGSRMAGYLSLTKPRLVLMVLVTVAVGYLLGARGGAHPTTLAITPSTCGFAWEQSFGMRRVSRPVRDQGV